MTKLLLFIIKLAQDIQHIPDFGIHRNIYNINMCIGKLYSIRNNYILSLSCFVLLPYSANSKKKTIFLELSEKSEHKIHPAAS